MDKEATFEEEDLFQPALFFPSQYRDLQENRHFLRPEKRLMLAVLEDAIHCFQHFLQARNRRGRRLHQEAAGWIFSRDNGWLFSFESICVALDFDPEYIRRGLWCWRKSRVERKDRHGKGAQLQPQPERTSGPGEKEAPALLWRAAS